MYDDEASVPQSSVYALIRDTLGKEIRCSEEARDVLHKCANEFIRLCASQASEICTKKKRTVMNADCVMEALVALEFEEYKPLVEEVQESLGARSRRKSEWKKGRFKRLDDATEAQLVEDQKRLFEEAARAFQEKEATEYAKEADMDLEDLKDEEDDPNEEEEDDDDDDNDNDDHVKEEDDDVESGESDDDNEIEEKEEKEDTAKIEDELTPEEKQDQLARQGMFAPGNYIRVIFDGDIEPELIQKFPFKKNMPLIMAFSRANAQQTRLTMLQGRLKKHRWFPKKVLKTKDPLFVSIGFHRFQTIPVFSMKNPHQTQDRMVKYTPEHLHCFGTFYGPAYEVNAGMVFYHTQDTDVRHFRISATGTLTEVAESFDMVKKLRLVGHPSSIRKNTAYIKDMFHSDLEVAKYENAKIRTVSGIRGSIKKAHKSQGEFRAVFEDRILMSDIVFLRTFAPIDVPKFYNPVIALPKYFTRMRAPNEIRRAEGIPLVVNHDSEYQEIVERPEVRKFNPLKIPKSLHRALPIHSKPKLEVKRRRKTLEEKRKIMLEPEEKKKVTLIQQLNTIRNERLKKRKQKLREHQKKVFSEKRKEDERKNVKLKQRKHEHMRLMGLKERGRGDDADAGGSDRGRGKRRKTVD
eukprot:TRINITY_DN1169_c1_g5_i1.p1 TRINITY_DN1169_c1_g5~~TRINITY_DN1169_c1_g5_i1.p1  ORF type:complete len:636 (-),score=221.62 TRINITY_DN1169_c1_g5_i1:132-2039(-)